MSGFTSTTLIGLAVGAIGQIDPDLCRGILRPDPMQAGVVSDRDKLTLLTAFTDRHGASAVLRIGQYLDLDEESPVIAVLVRSVEPTVLAEKWMRLERYYHSIHRTRIDNGTPRQWQCRRESKADPASAAENLLIAGILFGLLARIGAKDCRLSLGSVELVPNEIAETKFDCDAQHFSIRWSNDPAALSEDRSDAGTVNDRLADLLAGDIGLGWKLGEAARAMALSDRSLQRRLGEAGRSFSSVLRRARMRRATHLLTETATPMAEIGYCCGYADQAHFQRDFRRVSSVTPRSFRDVARQSAAIVQ
ncbi:AraC family transcriptional regulator [uncultured Mameliella sp.]|uniref:helix-turn-helix transcriptional regulator n=1 Tax=uncultured Mameliella sp. TaxID=1447087 RepID=UPI002609EC22|nr:AraC family transcriptional regulator [uncultured Mameliella sp.]